MKGLFPLFIGLFGTFAFSWMGLTVIPNLQIGHLDPQSDEEGTDIYPMPQSGMIERGRRVYAANGCIYCHSQQVRPDYLSSDVDRTRDLGPSPRPKWADRRSAPRDYIFDRPVLLGKARMGPDLTDIGKAGSAEEASPAPSAPAGSPAASPTGSPASAASPSGGANAATQSAASAAAPSPVQSASPAPPASSLAAPPAASPSPGAVTELRPYSAAWHHRHLYSPRTVSPDTRDSNMPAYQFLYEKHLIGGQRSAEALDLTGPDAPPAGWEIVPTYDAECLVAYLMSLDQSHPLKEVKGAAAPAGSPAASLAGSPAASPAAAKGGK